MVPFATYEGGGSGNGSEGESGNGSEGEKDGMEKFRQTWRHLKTGNPHGNRTEKIILA